MERGVFIDTGIPEVDIRQSGTEGARERGLRQANEEAKREASQPGLAPATYDSAGWPLASQVAICGVFVIMFIAALELARPVLLPATFAFVVGLMLGPLATKATRLGVPSLVTAIV